MEDQVKQVKCHTLNGKKVEFKIFIQQLVGTKGGSGAIVAKAIQASRPFQQLVVKMTPSTQTNKQKIKKQTQILRSLPDHPNLVKVFPLKIYSQNHSYIFMQYCKDGTLQDLIKQKNGLFTQQQIINIFYQVSSGYKVIWQNKILHQDLKPGNIFIKNGKFKIADFDLSIFHEGVTFGANRQGTFPYMSPQKLTARQYHANTKSDVYSMGVIFFKLIFKHHPYVIGSIKNLNEFVQKLLSNQIQISRLVISRMSIQMKQLFDMILKMLIKDEKNRVDFEEILQFIQQSHVFDEIKRKQLEPEKHQSQMIKISEEKPTQTINQSQAILIPFDIPLQKEQIYQNLVKRQIQKQEEQKFISIAKKIQSYLISMRLIIYFFDRLSRRLIVEKMKIFNKENKKITKEQLNIEKVIFALIILTKKINQQTIKGQAQEQMFDAKYWQKYKKRGSEYLKLIEKDRQYLSQHYEDSIMQKSQIEICEKDKIIKKSSADFKDFMGEIKKYLQELIEYRRSNIDTKNRTRMITLVYLISSVRIIDNFSEWVQQSQQMEGYFRQIQTQSLPELLQKIIQGAEQLKIPVTYQEDDQQQFEKIVLKLQ